ncbi:MAG: hypothetical protein R6U65_04430 [Perlabentimonas sp.]
MKKRYCFNTIKRLMSGMLQKRFLISLIVLLIVAQARAQAPLVSKQQLGMFLNSVTCVVLESDVNPYNVIIKDAVEKHWKVTPFEFIDEEEFEIRRSDTRYSFIVQMKNVFDNDPGGVSYSFIGLVMGDRAKDMTQMPEICNVPFQYSDDNSLDYEYAMPAIVKFMQIHAENLQNKRFWISLRGLQYYNSSGFKGKQLLMNIDNMAPDAYSIEKINTVYPYYVKLLSSSEIKEQIESNPKNSLFHFHVGPNEDRGVGKCFEMIFDVEGNLYYYNSRRITNEHKDGFTLNDFKRIR